jgi:hypothetical protein
MDQQSQSIRQESKRMSEEMRRLAAEERHRSEALARQLSQESMRQWQRSFEGLLAFPAAAALSMASSALYIAAIVERGFEIFQQSAEAVRSGVEEVGREQQRREGDGRSAEVGGLRGENREAHA